MKLINSLSADYWIKNTEKIYAEKLHISTPVMEAYEAGFRAAIELVSDVSYEDCSQCRCPEKALLRAESEVSDKSD